MAWRGRETALKLSVGDFKGYLSGLSFNNWRPSGMVLHNTGSPSLKRWQDYPGERWLKNLKSYYASLGWQAGPHAFVDGNHIWVMTDFNVKGTHSPSFNGTRLGIEMVADFSVEDADTGPGLKVKMMTVALFAITHERMGWDPDTIKFHKDDPQTDHDCPGKDVKKPDFIRLVKEYMGEGGEHPNNWSGAADKPTSPPTTLSTGTVTQNGLNVRSSPSANSVVIGGRNRGDKVIIVGEAMNNETKWLRIELGGSNFGWVAARYVKIQPQEKVS